MSVQGLFCTWTPHLCHRVLADRGDGAEQMEERRLSCCRANFKMSAASCQTVTELLIKPEPGLCGPPGPCELSADQLMVVHLRLPLCWQNISCTLNLFFSKPTQTSSFTAVINNKAAAGWIVADQPAARSIYWKTLKLQPPRCVQDTPLHPEARGIYCRHLARWYQTLLPWRPKKTL